MLEGKGMEKKIKKKMKDVTFEEFNKWCNMRACDAQWSLSVVDTLNCIEVLRRVSKVKPLFGRKRAREKEWERVKKEYFNLDAECELTYLYKE